jgi:hypothetical protein
MSGQGNKGARGKGGKGLGKGGAKRHRNVLRTDSITGIVKPDVKRSVYLDSLSRFTSKGLNLLGFCGCFGTLTCAKCTQKRQKFLEAQERERQAKIEAQAKAEAKAEVQRLADIEYDERLKRYAIWQRELNDLEEQRKEVERLKAIEVEKKRQECNPFYLVRSTTDGEFDDWVNCFSMNLEGDKRLYFVFSGNEIKELDLLYDENLNLRTVEVAGHIKTTGEKLEIISKTDYFYFLKGNKSPYKKHNHLIVATYEFFTEFYIDHRFYFGQSTFVDPQRNNYARDCHN